MCCTCKPRNCCCCFSIEVGTHIIGGLDCLAFVAAIAQIIIIGVATKLNLIFFNGSFLYTAIPSLLLVRLVRFIFYLVMLPQRNLEKRRDWYFKARFITFFIAIVISIIDLIINAAHAKNDEGDV